MLQMSLQNPTKYIEESAHIYNLYKIENK